MPETDVESRLAALEAKEELRAFIAAYCRACDSMSGDAVAAMFTADAVLRNAAGEHTGRDAIRAYYAAFYDGKVAFSRHHVLNQVITLLEPDVARHEAYFIAMTGAGGQSRIIFGCYEDTVVRQDGCWLFADKRNDVVGATSLQAGWAEGFASLPA